MAESPQGFAPNVPSEIRGKSRDIAAKATGAVSAMVSSNWLSEDSFLVRPSSARVGGKGIGSSVAPILLSGPGGCFSAVFRNPPSRLMASIQGVSSATRPPPARWRASLGPSLRRKAPHPAGGDERTPGADLGLSDKGAG